MALQPHLWYSASRSQSPSRWPQAMDLDSILKCYPNTKLKSSWRYGWVSPFDRTIANGLNPRLNTPQPSYSSPAFASPNYRCWSSFATWLPHPWIAASPSCWEYLLGCGLLPVFLRRYFNVIYHRSGIIYKGLVSIEWVAEWLVPPSLEKWLTADHVPECVVEVSWHHKHFVRGRNNRPSAVGYRSYPDRFRQKGWVVQCILDPSHVGVKTRLCLRESSTNKDGTRSVIISIIFQLVYARQTARGDFTYDSWAVAISTQVAQTVSIVTACSPQFKPFLDSLQSSGMGLGLTSSNNYGSKHKTYGMTTFKTFRRTADTRSETHELVSVPHEGNEANNQTMVTSAPDEDAESQSSRSNMIMETRTWTVTEGLPNWFNVSKGCFRST